MLNTLRVGTGYLLTRLVQHLAGNGRYRRTRKDTARDSSSDSELFIEFISSDLGYIVSSRVEEEIVKKCLGALYERGIARTELAVYLFVCFFLR